MKQSNPFFDMVGLMQEEAKGVQNAPFFIGTVLQAVPLCIQIGEIQVDRAHLKINDALLTGYTRSLALATTAAQGQTKAVSGGSGEASFSSHSHSLETVGFSQGTVTTQDGLKTGDEVLVLMSADQQQFMVLCRLV